ncbi:MAG TPA: nucleotidyltransferase substrate binding protein [Anditalea sp.]|nr:nucleotidyltransferase substrate binding protein [Anditalea sp.]
MKTPTINWHIRLNSYSEALEELKEYLQEYKIKGASDKLELKILRAFEVSHELALNTMMEYFREQGHQGITGPRDATTEAFHADLIDDGEAWLDMIICRIKASPLYNEDVNKKLVDKTAHRFVNHLENFERKMKWLEEGN